MFLRRPKKKNDRYIALLEICKEKFENHEHIKDEDLKLILQDLGFDFNSDVQVEKKFAQAVLNHVRSTVFWEYDDYHHFFISIKSYFQLLEYQELKEARRTAFIAQVFSGIAVFLTLVTLGVSISFSVRQINTPILIDNEQMEIIKSLANDQLSLSATNGLLEDILD